MMACRHHKKSSTKENPMKAITIRGLEPQVSEKLKTAAQKESKSVNQFVIETIKEKLGLKKQKYSIIYDDLDHLFGKWSEDEYEEIQGRIDGDRKIDQELWK
jgi:DNA-binding transcriptional regulator YiaG